MSKTKTETKLKNLEGMKGAIEQIVAQAWERGYKYGLREAEDEIMPHGEWGEPFTHNGKTYHKCNHCRVSSQLILIDDYCPNCGAWMRKKEAGNEQ